MARASKSSVLSSSLVSPTRFFLPPYSARQADGVVPSLFPLPARTGDSSPSLPAKDEDEDEGLCDVLRSGPDSEK